MALDAETHSRLMSFFRDDAVEVKAGKAVAFVDRADLPLVSKHVWALCHGYPITGKAGERILMHRMIMKPQAGLHVDHIDGNPLNNRRSNLRVCTHAENMRNKRKCCSTKTPFKGVSLDRTAYRATIKANGERHYLGLFSSAKKAALAYDAAAERLHGAFASTNEDLGLI